MAENAEKKIISENLAKNTNKVSPKNFVAIQLKP